MTVQISTGIPRARRRWRASRGDRLAHRAGSLPGGGACLTLLELSGVNTHIGQYHILQGVDLMVPRGELTVLLGRNGAGKTTTLRTIMGLWHASRGALLFDGRDITQAATPDISCAGSAYVPENMGIFSDLTVR